MRLAARSVAASLAACLAPVAAAAAPGACPQAPAPAVTVALPEAGVEVRAVDSVESMARFPLVSAEARAGGWRLSGLTVADTDAYVSVAGLQVPGCYVVVSVSVTLGFQGPLRVYVPSRYREGSCPLAAVMDHEMQHVAVHRLARDVHAPRIKAAVEAALAATRAFPDQASATAAMSGLVGDGARAMAAAAGAANAALDTPESYAAVQARCADW